MGMLGGNPEFFGLDIGTSAIRVVQLRGKDSNKTVFRYGKAMLEQRLMNQANENALAEIANIIRDLLVQNQITTRNVVMGLPTRNVYSTIREFDNMAAKDFSKTLKFQMNMIVPDAEGSSKVDWAILDPEVQEAEKKEVFICSVKNDYIETRLEMLESLNLNVLCFEPDSLALARATANSGNMEQASMIIDFGFNDTDIVISLKNQPRLITSVDTGVSHIIKAIINTLNVDQVKGQQLAFQIGLNPDPQYIPLRNAILQTLDNLLAQLRKSISFFITRYSNYNLAQIVLCGDAAYIPGFAAFLTQQTNLPTVLGDAWQNVICPQGLSEELKNYSVDFIVAAGLAERQVI